MSRISVIVPVYNVEKYLNRCIDSILAQTFTNFELILVDDGSPDNCGKICDEYAEKDNRIHVIHKENGGLSDARNAGIDWAFANSNSEWITFIDSDDWIHPRYLEALYDAVKSTGCEISICGFERTERDEPAVDDTKLRAVSVNSEDFFCNHNVNAVVAWGKLYKKELLREIRYPVGKLHEDEFTTYKLLFQYENCAFVNQPLYFYYKNNDGITKSKLNIRRMVVFDAYQLQLSFFENSGFVKAQNKTLSRIANTYVSYIESLENDTNHYPEIKRLKKGLRKHLHKYKKVANYSVKSTPIYYNYAYPRSMKYYWIVKTQLKKRIRKANEKS